MRKEYDFTNAKKNPYAQKLKKQITIRIEKGTIEYFKALSKKTGVPYQSLMNLYLSDCAQKQKEISWN